MNTHLNHQTPPPAPQPLCAVYAPLLPLLRVNELDANQADAVRAHLADCVWCQAKLATHTIVGDALRRHFGPGHVAPSAVTLEEIMRATDQEDRISPGDSDAHDEPVATELRTPPPRRWLHQPRQLLSGFATVAAVLLVALLAELLFALHQPPTGRQPIISLRIVRTGRFTEYSLPVPTRIYLPDSIVAGRDGTLWFTETNKGAIGRLSPSGAYTEFPLPHPDSGPNGLALGPDGNFWFTEWFDSKVGRITPAGAITEFAVPSGAKHMSGLGAITAGPDGNLWFAEQLSDQIGRITPQGTITEFPVPAAPESGPSEITAGPDGNLWFTDQDGNRVGRITPQGKITEFPLPTAGSTPDGITTGPDGSLWFIEANGDRIGRITPQGKITEFPLPEVGGIMPSPWPGGGGPGPITKGPDGNLWFVEYSGNAIGRITPHGLLTEFPLPTSSSGPDSITTGPDGGLWFTEQNADKIGRFSP